MEVIYEDNHIIAVNKTCREIVQEINPVILLFRTC